MPQNFGMPFWGKYEILVVLTFYIIYAVLKAGLQFKISQLIHEEQARKQFMLLATDSERIPEKFLKLNFRYDY